MGTCDHAIRRTFRSSFSRTSVIRMKMIASTMIRASTNMRDIMPIPHGNMNVFLPASTNVLGTSGIFAHSINMRTRRLRIIRTMIIMPIILPIMTTRVHYTFAVFRNIIPWFRFRIAQQRNRYRYSRRHRVRRFFCPYSRGSLYIYFPLYSGNVQGGSCGQVVFPVPIKRFPCQE